MALRFATVVVLHGMPEQCRDQCSSIMWLDEGIMCFISESAGYRAFIHRYRRFFGQCGFDEIRAVQDEIDLC